MPEKHRPENEEEPSRRSFIKGLGASILGAGAAYYGINKEVEKTLKDNRNALRPEVPKELTSVAEILKDPYKFRKPIKVTLTPTETESEHFPDVMPGSHGENAYLTESFWRVYKVNDRPAQEIVLVQTTEEKIDSGKPAEFIVRVGTFKKEEAGPNPRIHLFTMSKQELKED